MWRFFAIATAIVAVAILAILASRGTFDRIAAPLHYASGSGTPGPAVRDDFRRPPEPVTGDAPWALSALPECFRQRSSAQGPPAFVRSHIPRDARPVRAPATLRVADCSLAIGAGSAVVMRGENRLLIAPRARFYVAGRRLILERNDGVHGDVRAYTLAGDAAPAFTPGSRAAKP